MSTSSFTGANMEDQDRLLDEAAAVVKEQAYYMRQAIDRDNLRDSLKHASNMICELRTSLLSPKNYYELYMQVFEQMQHLSEFFGDKERHKRKMLELYESVQHAGNILPRLYLLATVGAQYIKSKDAPAKEILKDMSELCKGVQHPLRGLFLRYYLSQMVKDKLPDTGSDYEAAGGGDINDAFDFIFSNFQEANTLWVRMQNQGSVKDKARRERDRYDLRALVSCNLSKLSQLDGMTIDFYANIALPRLLEHMTAIKDTMSQQCLFESMIQCFPDEFHLRSLQVLLAAFTKAQPTVDMKPIMVTLMNRLSSYLTAQEDTSEFTNVDVFGLFRTHLSAILERSLEPGPQGSIDVSSALEMQAAFMGFTMSLYPDKIENVDAILGSTVDLVRKYFAKTENPVQKLDGSAADKVVNLLATPMKTLSLRVLEMEHYPALLNVLQFDTRRRVAFELVNSVIDKDLKITSAEQVNSLFVFVSSLIKDEDDTPPEDSMDKEVFTAEQHQVAKLVHQMHHPDTDVTLQILTTMRGFFGQGGPGRMVHTLQAVVSAALQLLPRIVQREAAVANGEEGVTAPQANVKKVFQFVHKTITAIGSNAPEAALQLWLLAAVSADQTDKLYGQQGAFENICYEFFTQGLIVFEEEISETTRQYQAIFKIAGTLYNITCLDAENFDTCAQKMTQHSARLLKKPMQIRAIATCSHLFWCHTRQDGKRVSECLQKCLKILDAVCQSDHKNVCIWPEMLDKYVQYFEMGLPEVPAKHIQGIVDLCKEHIAFGEQDATASQESALAKAHFEASVKYIKARKSAPDGAVAARFAEIEL